uniref:Cuticlin N-terminal domain-containing protein n=1 Tax=Angiostrongylus cantonensis TaxID=6313 RepID=A0A0K0CWT3_ANGCA
MCICKRGFVREDVWKKLREDDAKVDGVIMDAKDTEMRSADKPIIECGHGKLSVSVSTEKQPPSHVFAKGHFNRPECSFRNTTQAVFDFEKCDINRKREVVA